MTIPLILFDLLPAVSALDVGVSGSAASFGLEAQSFITISTTYVDVCGVSRCRMYAMLHGSLG